MQKITPCLWFDDQAEEAANFYVSVFPNSRLTGVARFGEAAAEISGRPGGSIMTVTFELDRQSFMALNGGPVFTFSPAISLMVNCETQEELDQMWGKLLEGGEAEQCGWLKDKYGVSWQIVPTIIGELMQDQDVERSERVMRALLQMVKIEIEPLKQAYEHD